jgi:23S rRNA pseudouridine2605 synthase
MRLNRYLAQSGVASRRAAEEVILAGRVTINGAVCTELSRQVAPTDSVKVDGKLVHPAEPIYVLLNKPADYLTTRSDDRARPTIYHLLPRNFHQLAHVGRLDLDSEGLLILTNDGELTLRLTHPRYKLPKEYLVTLDREFDMADMPKVKRGVFLSEGRARFDSLTKLNSRQVRVILTQGLTRQVRRVFAAIGYKVRRLQRTKIGPLFDTALKPGEYRLLRPAEVAKLRGRREAE